MLKNENRPLLLKKKSSRKVLVGGTDVLHQDFGGTRSDRYFSTLSETRELCWHMLRMYVVSTFLGHTITALFPSFCTSQFDDPAKAIGWGTFGFFVSNALGTFVIPAMADEYGFSMPQLYSFALSAFFLLWLAVSSSFVQLVVPTTLSGFSFANGALTMAFFNLTLPYAMALRLTAYIHVFNALSIGYGGILAVWATETEFSTDRYKAIFLVCSLIAFAGAVYIHNFIFEKDGPLLLKQYSLVQENWPMGEEVGMGGDDSVTETVVTSEDTMGSLPSPSLPSSSSSHPTHSSLSSDNGNTHSSHRRPRIEEGRRLRLRRRRFRDEFAFPFERKRVETRIKMDPNLQQRWYEVPSMSLFKWVHIGLACAQSFVSISIVSVFALWFSYFLRHKYGVSGLVCSILGSMGGISTIIGVLFVTDFISFLDKNSGLQPFHPSCLPPDPHGFLYGSEKIAKTWTGVMSAMLSLSIFLAALIPQPYWWLWFLLVCPLAMAAGSFVMLSSIQIMAVQPPSAVGKIHGLRSFAEVCGTAIVDVIVAENIDDNPDWFLYIIAICLGSQLAVMLGMALSDCLRIALNRRGMYIVPLSDDCLSLTELHTQRK